MLALWARYQLRAVGLRMNASQSRTAREEGSPGEPPASATDSQPSRRSRSLIARHHRLPGGDPFDLQLQRSQLRYVTTSEAQARALAENYVGLERV